MPSVGDARPASALLASLLLSLTLTTEAAAQQAAAPSVATADPEPFQILDNSFFVEEAFNQEAGIFQNIFGANVVDGTWVMSFVQEWPVRSQSHQLSYTLTWAAGDGGSAFGNTLINYRFQALSEGPGRPAFAPRISAVLPTVSGDFDVDAWGVQFNLPFSKQTGDFYWHWNAGMTWLPSVDAGNGSFSLESPFVSGSSIYRLAPMFHLMLEAVAGFNEEVIDEDTTRPRTLTLSPGVRGGWDIGDHQLIVGLAIPTVWTSNERRETGAFIYLSYELPFRR